MSMPAPTVPLDPPPQPPPTRRWAFFVAGAVAVAVAIAVGEILAGLVAGAPSLVVAIGSLVVDLQPPGAKDLVVSLFGTNDKLALNILILVVALAVGGGLGLVARTRPTAANAGFAVFGAVALFASLRLALNSPVAVGHHGRPVPRRRADDAALPDRRRARLERPPARSGRPRRWTGRGRPADARLGPAPVPRRCPARWPSDRWPSGTSAGPSSRAPTRSSPRRRAFPSPGCRRRRWPRTPPCRFRASPRSSMPNDQFYRIDTALIVPRVDVATWTVKVNGMVDQPLTFTYDQLAAMPIFEQYVTIACVSNEVGGDLVGNALWRGVHLRDVLAMAGVQPGGDPDRRPLGRRVHGRLPDRLGDGPGARSDDRPRDERRAAAGRARLPGAADRARPVRLRVGDEVAGRDRADDARGVRRLLGPARLGEGGADPDPVADRRAARRRGARARSRSPSPAWPGRRTGASRRSRSGSTRATGSRPPCRRRSRRRPGSSGEVGWNATAGDHTIEVRATDGTGQVQTDQVSPPAPGRRARPPHDPGPRRLTARPAGRTVVGLSGHRAREGARDTVPGRSTRTVSTGRWLRPCPGSVREVPTPQVAVSYRRDRDRGARGRRKDASAARNAATRRRRRHPGRRAPPDRRGGLRPDRPGQPVRRRHRPLGVAVLGRARGALADRRHEPSVPPGRPPRPEPGPPRGRSRPDDRLQRERCRGDPRAARRRPPRRRHDGDVARAPRDLRPRRDRDRLLRPGRVPGAHARPPRPLPRDAPRVAGRGARARGRVRRPDGLGDRERPAVRGHDRPGGPAPGDPGPERPAQPASRTSGASPRRS